MENNNINRAVFMFIFILLTSYFLYSKMFKNLELKRTTTHEIRNQKTNATSINKEYADITYLPEVEVVGKKIEKIIRNP